MNLNSKQFIKLFQNEKAISSILDYYITSKQMYGNIEDIQEDIEDLYDELIENIDSIISNYV